MKRMKTGWSCFRCAFSRIHLVDKFLILFMVVLLAQSAFNLFVNHTVTAETNNIDTIIRTSIAGIFGYILSTNFICHADSGAQSGSAGENTITTQKNEGIQNRIGFSDTDSPNELEAGHANFTGNPNLEGTASRLQIITAACIGLFSLVVLVVLRNVKGFYIDMTASASSAATVAQFRDIVSGCIGFLIGCPSAGKNKP